MLMLGMASCYTSAADSLDLPNLVPMRTHDACLSHVSNQVRVSQPLLTTSFWPFQLTLVGISTRRVLEVFVPLLVASVVSASFEMFGGRRRPMGAKLETTSSD